MKCNGMLSIFYLRGTPLGLRVIAEEEPGETASEIAKLQIRFRN